MFSVIGALGSGIGTNLLSDALVKKLTAFKDQKVVQHFYETLHEWEIHFVQENDGTIVTSGDFYAYTKHYCVVENIVSYALDPSGTSISEKDFLEKIKSEMTVYLEEKTAHALSWIDKEQITAFLAGLLSLVKEFLLSQVSLQDRGMLYVLCQNNIELEQIKQILVEQFQVQEEHITSIQNQLSSLLKIRETKDDTTEKLNSWNSREIKNLGDRYNPEVNIPLNIMEVLDGATLDPKFKHCFLEKTDQFLISMRDAGSEEFQEECSAVARIVTELDFFDFNKDNIGRLLSHIDNILKVLAEKIEECYQAKDKKSLNSTIYKLYRKRALAEDYRDYLISNPVQAAMSPYIVLTGDGGVGKSHLMADYVEKRMVSSQASLLLLCQNILGEEVFLSSLPRWIGFTDSYYEFFDDLEKIAVSQQSRLLICIDALNEGIGVEYWNNSLAGIVEFLEKYSHIGLIVSVRTQYEDDLFDGQDVLRSKMLRIIHTGFSTVTYTAMHRYFSFYGITTDSIVFPSTEFNNPLFLRLFCVSHRNSHIRLEDLSLPDVYRQYIAFEEERIAKKCDYPKSYKMVSKIMEAMISKRASEKDGMIRLPHDTALKLVIDIGKQWDVNSTGIYKALLGEGILTRSMGYDGGEYVHITYERLEDYFIAEKIFLAYAEFSKETFLEKYSWITRRGDLLEFFGIILAEEKGTELGEVFSTDDPRNASQICSAFLYGLTWRKGTSFTEKTWDYINHEILNYENSFLQFIDLLFALSARSNHPLNALRTFEYFQEAPMPERDAEFIPVFDELYADQASALYSLIEWGLNHAREQRVPDDVAETSALILCRLLISPNTELRDRATKAIICILLSHTNALIALMHKFEKIDDPYILERIYAIAFGCVVNEECSNKISALAKYVYVTVFDKDTVYPNVLLRTYAKNIIDYARYMGCLEGEDIQSEKITPPYCSVFPEIPSDEEIRNYKLNYKDPTFKKHHWAQNNILDSMKVEYSRDGQPGGYGDFGRYTFQSYFYSWQQLHPMDLKNIAIKRIFDLGYDVELHGRYDRECTNSVRIGTQPGKRERIGKKYQWIAFYELAAQVCDHYKMTLHVDVFGDCCQEYCRGSFEPDIRNIDPTVLTPPAVKTHGGTCHVPYVIPTNTYEEWLADFSTEPSFEQCTALQYKHQRFLLLAGNYRWVEPKCIGTRSYDFPRKDFWHQIRGYIVKTEHLNSILQALKGVDFMGRRMPELQNNSGMYNKEYYWSDANTFYKTPYYGNADWITIDEDFSLFQKKIMIPVRQYFSERRGELNVWGSEMSALSWYKPCEEIYTKLGLKYLKGSNCQLVDSSGDLICFDTSETLGDEVGFYIRQDKLSEFLDMCGYSLIWTSLREKRILHHMGEKWDLPPKAIHMSSVNHFKDGRIIKTSEAFIEDTLF